MPSLAAAKQLNSTAFKALKDPVLVCLGGTSGIGEHCAKVFARNTVNPRVFIVGRNQERASQILDELKAANGSGTYEFLQADMSLIANAKDVSTKLKTKVEAIDYLVMTTGFVSLAGRTETREGLDVKMALHYYSRMAVTMELLPVIKKGGGVMSVLDSVHTTENKVYWNDLDLKKHYGVTSCAYHTTTFTDAIVKELAKRKSDAKSIHASPGFVNTNVISGLPWYLRGLAKVFSPFATSPEDCAEYLMSSFARPESGALYTNSSGDKVDKPGPTDEHCKMVWDHTTNVVGTSV